MTKQEKIEYKDRLHDLEGIPYFVADECENSICTINEAQKIADLVDVEIIGEYAQECEDLKLPVDYEALKLAKEKAISAYDLMSKASKELEDLQEVFIGLQKSLVDDNFDKEEAV